MDALSAILTIKAMDGLQARSVATAQNIANADSVGYRPVRVDFEAALAAAARSGAQAARAVAPRLRADAAGAGVRLDLEMSTAVATAGRYAALADILNRQLQLQSLATTGNG